MSNYKVTVEIMSNGKTYNFDTIKISLPADVIDEVTGYLEAGLPEAAGEVLVKYFADHEDEILAMADYADKGKTE